MRNWFIKMWMTSGPGEDGLFFRLITTACLTVAGILIAFPAKGVLDIRFIVGFTVSLTGVILFGTSPFRHRGGPLYPTQYRVCESDRGFFKIQGWHPPLMCRGVEVKPGQWSDNFHSIVFDTPCVGTEKYIKKNLIAELTVQKIGRTHSPDLGEWDCKHTFDMDKICGDKP